MKQIIEKVALGALLMLAVIIGPALSSANLANIQTAAVIQGTEVPDFTILNPLTREQLIEVIKCKTLYPTRTLSECVNQVLAAATTGTASTVIASAPLIKILSDNHAVSTISGVANVPLMAFLLRGEGGNSSIQSVTVVATGTMASRYHLYDGNTLIASKAGASQVTFDGLSTSIPKDGMKTLVVKADYSSSTPVGGAVSGVSIKGITYRSGDGALKTLSLSPFVTGEDQHFFRAAASIAPARAPTITTVSAATSGGTTTLIAIFPLQISSKGGSTRAPSTDGSDVMVSFGNGTREYVATSKSVVIIPNQDIPDGTTSSMTVTASANGSTLLTSGLYTAKITAIKWTTGSVSAVQTWGLQSLKTPSAVQFQR